MDPAHLNLFKTRLQDPSPRDALLALARQFRDSGSSQLDLLRLFSHFQQRLSPEDPCYDAVVDNMDLISGGPWAKGHSLFPTELHTIAGAQPGVPPAPWIEIDVAGDDSLEEELAREIGPAHVLANRAGRALLRRGDCDDVLFAVRKSPEVALVHLTWSGSRESGAFPRTRVFASMLDWYDEVEKDLTG